MMDLPSEAYAAAQDPEVEPETDDQREVKGSLAIKLVAKHMNIIMTASASEAPRYIDDFETYVEPFAKRIGGERCSAMLDACLFLNPARGSAKAAKKLVNKVVLGSLRPLGVISMANDQRYF